MTILSLNAGSSSLKFGLYNNLSTGERSVDNTAEAPQLLSHGEIESIDGTNACLRIDSTSSPATRIFLGKVSINDAVTSVIEKCSSVSSIDAVGCRVVHGGPHFNRPIRVTSEVLEDVRALRELAPLHNATAVSVLETTARLLPQAALVAVFDTAFHHDLPAIASTYALPFELCEKHHLRRYGFHGISHKYVSERLQELWGQQSGGSRLISCHLGNGASVCAIRDGRSIDISMGLTPLEGLVMGTRCGDLDPGLILHLQEVFKLPVDIVADLLNHQSGLLGISGFSSDVRELENAAQHDGPRARLALEIFAYRASKYIGSYAIALEGLDVLAFTGGVGQYSPETRARICSRLEVLGVQISVEKNRLATGREPACIGLETSKVPVWIIPADEELQIARETYSLIAL